MYSLAFLSFVEIFAMPTFKMAGGRNIKNIHNAITRERSELF